MNDCVFCKIVAGDLPASKVYEDDYFLGFLSIRPINPGHMLVVPKQHVESAHELNEVAYTELMKRVRHLSITVNSVLKPEKVGLMISGWDVPHVHVHVVPMYDVDDITSKKAIEDTISNPSREELHDMAERLRSQIGNNRD